MKQPICRVDITQGEGSWTAVCLTDNWTASAYMAVEAFEAAFEHYRQGNHVGNMFVDVKPAAKRQVPREAYTDIGHPL